MRLQHVLTALILCLIAIPSFAQAEDKPNIVIILTDDQGYADVSYNPHSPPEVSTPNIDALAHSSIICTQGYTSGHVCSPTRAGLMTGRYQPGQIDKQIAIVKQLDIKGKTVTVPEALKKELGVTNEPATDDKAKKKAEREKRKKAKSDK